MSTSIFASLLSSLLAAHSAVVVALAASAASPASAAGPQLPFLLRLLVVPRLLPDTMLHQLL